MPEGSCFGVTPSDTIIYGARFCCLRPSFSGSPPESSALPTSFCSPPS